MAKGEKNINALTVVDGEQSTKVCYEDPKGKEPQDTSISYKESSKESRTYTRTNGFTLSAATPLIGRYLIKNHPLTNCIELCLEKPINSYRMFSISLSCLSRKAFPSVNPLISQLFLLSCLYLHLLHCFQIYFCQ